MVTPVLIDVHHGRRDPAVPFIHADDLAVVRGDGIFETLLVRDAKVCNVARHLARMRAGARRMDLPDPDPVTWGRAVEDARAAWVDANGDVEGAAPARLLPWAGIRSADMDTPAGHDRACW